MYLPHVVPNIRPWDLIFLITSKTKNDSIKLDSFSKLDIQDTDSAIIFLTWKSWIMFWNMMLAGKLRENLTTLQSSIQTYLQKLKSNGKISIKVLKVYFMFHQIFNNVSYFHLMDFFCQCPIGLLNWFKIKIIAILIFEHKISGPNIFTSIST